MQDYSAIVESHAKQLGATIYDLLDLDGIADAIDEGTAEFAAQHIMEVLVSGRDPGEAAFSDIGLRALFVALPIKNELGCMVAMHELGHIATTKSNRERGIECEAKATQWALDNIGFTLSPPVAEATLKALGTYEQNRHQTHPKAGTYAFRVHQELEPIAKRK